MEREPADVVGSELLDICRALGESALASEYYLAGGTTLALQLGHRRSLDLDWFHHSTRERVPAQTIARELERTFPAAVVQTVRRQVDQAVWTVRGIRVTFLAYPFPLRYELIPGGRVHEALGNLWLASPQEVALMKAYALGRRATFRDYVDLYYLLQTAQTSIAEIVAEASRKFVLEGRRLFNARLFLEQLVYFRDLDDVDVTLQLLPEPPTADEMRAFLEEQVRTFVQQQARGGSES